MLKSAFHFLFALGSCSLAAPNTVIARPFFLKFFQHRSSTATGAQSAASPGDPMSMIPPQLMTPGSSPEPSSSPEASSSPGPTPAATPIVGVNGFGAPISGLSGDELQKFIDGQQQFIAFNGPQNGLGPIFNNQSCLACHTQPVGANPSLMPTGPDTPAQFQDVTPGGGSAFTELRAGFTDPSNGTFIALLPNNGTLFHLSSLPAITGGMLPDNMLSQENIPLQANTKAHRRSNPLFGLGLIDAIDDSTIRAGVHNPPLDGVSGMVADLSGDPVTQAVAASGSAPQHFVGRFGWKAQQATLLAFSADAYLNEMGITNKFFPRDLAPNGNEEALAAAEPMGFTLDSPDQLVQLTPDSIQDIENDIQQFTNFMTFLAPPPTIPLSPSAQNGQRAFTQIGCSLCHTPSMVTGQSSSPALSFRQVSLYSDLLLHDLGPALHDNIPQAAAPANMTRTAPLMGLRGHAPFLHDGRALSLLDAIKAHAGEASTVIGRFNALSNSDQNDILNFLNSI